MSCAERMTSATANSSGIVSTQTLTCPTGYQATGGGWDLDSINGAVTSSLPIGTSQWQFLVTQLSSGQVINLYVKCATITTG